jgi:mono/diheme cytochrome c family protein
MKFKTVFRRAAVPWVAILFCVVVIPLFGCRSVRRGEPIVGPLPVNDPAVERGRVAFAQHCFACHPGGEGGLGPGLNDKLFPRFLMKTQVRLGLGAMPGFDAHKIPPEELSDILKFVVAQRRHNEPVTR